MKQHNIFSKFKFNLWEAYYVTIARHINLVNQLISLIIRCFILSSQAVYNHHFLIDIFSRGDGRHLKRTVPITTDGEQSTSDRAADRQADTPGSFCRAASTARLIEAINVP